MQNTTGIEIDDRGGAALILCPRCGAEHLRHLGVTIYDRPEDAAQVTETHVSGGRVSMGISDGRGNPSGRREGLAIDFACESCGDQIQLLIAQHKGSSEIGWRFEPKTIR